MKKYEILFYNRFAHEDQIFKVIARHKKEARDLFLLMYPRKQYGFSMDEIYVREFHESSFYTKEEIYEILNMLEKVGNKT
jgi:hypothetical protein